MKAKEPNCFYVQRWAFRLHPHTFTRERKEYI
jgi:hypothetical protein